MRRRQTEQIGGDTDSQRVEPRRCVREKAGDRRPLRLRAPAREDHGGQVAVAREANVIELDLVEAGPSSSLGNISLHDLRAEIGWSWLGKEFRSTGLNKHAKYAMMRYAFDELNFERIEFKTDVLNDRARQGLKNIGGVEEGILRSHMTMWNNRRRSSIYYSVLKDEWPKLKNTLFKEFD